MVKMLGPRPQGPKALGSRPLGQCLAFIYAQQGPWGQGPGAKACGPGTLGLGRTKMRGHGSGDSLEVWSPGHHAINRSQSLS